MLRIELIPRSTNVVLIFLGANMLIILLFTSSVFTTWINSHFSSATDSAFNPYLVSPPTGTSVRHRAEAGPC